MAETKAPGWPEVPSHGSSGYQRGCRCEVCRAAKRSANARYSEKHRERLNQDKRARDARHRARLNESRELMDELYAQRAQAQAHTPEDAEDELRSHFDMKRGAELRELRGVLDDAREAIREKALAAAKADWPVAWIAAAAGVSMATVYKWLRDDEDGG